MRLLWTLLKVVIGIIFVVPVCIIVLAAALGILGTMLGLAILALKVAFAGFLVYGAFRLLTHLLGGPKASSRPTEVRELPKVDPYEAAAMRELDRELGIR